MSGDMLGGLLLGGLLLGLLIGYAAGVAGLQIPSLDRYLMRRKTRRDLREAAERRAKRGTE